MQLLTILFSMGFTHLWGTANPLQRDGWYWHWLDLLEKPSVLANQPLIRLMLGVGGPMVALLIIIGLLMMASSWLLLPLGVVVLLYSLGRQDIAEPVDAYTSACACDDWQLGVEQALSLGVDVGELTHGDWSRLHELVLQAAVYRGFERLFAPLFWFLLFGPVGALGYRLSWMYQHRYPDVASAAHRWVWVLEWPAVRLLGISFAVTGNFVGCLRRWRVFMTSETHSSKEVLAQSALGALLVDEELQLDCSITHRELSALQSLYSRTFWLWLGCIGVWGILR